MHSAKNNIHNIYKMNIFNNLNKLIPKQLYSASKHNVLALVFVLLVILVVQYPSIFSKSANTVFGKAIILLIIILLTNYNTLVGLVATIVALVFYVYLFDTVYEGAVGDMGTEKKDENTPKPDSAPAGISSTPSPVGMPAASLTAPPVASAAPAAPIPLATPLANPQEASQMEKMYSGQINMTQDSKSIPYEPVQNPYVQPSESMGNTKSTSNAISSPLMPAPASVTAPTMPI
jgi:hypothetical protein